jgi:glycerol-3-phosphate responsive antiterminator
MSLLHLQILKTFSMRMHSNEKLNFIVVDLLCGTNNNKNALHIERQIVEWNHKTVITTEINDQKHPQVVNSFRNRRIT